jgi:hypothetical protein
VICSSISRGAVTPRTVRSSGNEGFNTTDVPLEFCLLQGEIAEAFDAWRKSREDAGKELAGIAIYLFSLAEMAGVDLQGEVQAKIAKNAARSYRPLSNGVLVKSDDDGLICASGSA